MARTFHLSCMGPIDPASQPRAAMAASLSAFVKDPKAIEAILSARPHKPCRLNAPQGTLSKARALDASLLACGVFSNICFVDSAHPDKPGVFVNQRQGARRGDGSPPPAPSAAPAKAAPGDKRAATARGRRLEDKK